MKRVIFGFLQFLILLQFTDASVNVSISERFYPQFWQNSDNLKDSMYFNTQSMVTNDLIDNTYLSYDDGKTKLFPVLYGPISILCEKYHNQTIKFICYKDKSDIAYVKDCDTTKITSLSALKGFHLMFVDIGEDIIKVTYKYIILEAVTEKCFTIHGNIDKSLLVKDIVSYKKNIDKSSDELKK